jgi:uncharacterized membrane protein (UPF0136 family)
MPAQVVVGPTAAIHVGVSTNLSTMSGSAWLAPKPTGKWSGRLADRRWFWICGWIFILAVGVILKSLQPITYVFGASYDDELFVRMARDFLEGHWSSSYASTGAVTLAKPVGYPAFLAGVHIFPWSPVLSTYLLYLIGVVLIAQSWRRISKSRAQATVILAALTLNPIFFATANQRIYRDSFVDAVSTVAVGLAFVIAAELDLPGSESGVMETTSSRRIGAHGPRSAGNSLRKRYVPIGLAVLLGLTVGYAAITKPTWQWLIFAVIAPLAYPLVRRIRVSRHRVMSTMRIGLAALLAVVCGLSVISFTKYMNRQTYGVSLVDDLSEGALARTWKLWASVEATPKERYVAITRPMRLAVYRVSPAAAEMEPYLESPTDSWKATSCASPVRICTESANWFEWDLRSAAVSAGEVKSVRTIQTYFSTVADQIARACRSGELRCTSSPVLGTGLPPLSQYPIGSVVSNTEHGMWQMLRDQLQIGPQNSPTPTLEDYDLWRAVVPDLPPIAEVGRASPPSYLYPSLRLLNSLYQVGNVLLLAVLALGLVYSVATLLTRRPRVGRVSCLREASASGLFLLSAVIGMGTLSIYAATTGLAGYRGVLYWTDFAVSGELFLVFGAFASYSFIFGRIRVQEKADRDNGTYTDSSRAPSEVME